MDKGTIGKTFEVTIVDPNILESKTYKGSFQDSTNNALFSYAVKNKFDKIQENSTIGYGEKRKQISELSLESQVLS